MIAIGDMYTKLLAVAQRRLASLHDLRSARSISLGADGSFVTSGTGSVGLRIERALAADFRLRIQCAEQSLLRSRR